MEIQIFVDEKQVIKFAWPNESDIMAKLPSCDTHVAYNHCCSHCR